MRSDFTSRWTRRIRLGSLIAASPTRAGAIYQLVTAPHSLDVLSLGGLSKSRALDRLIRSSLIATGSVHVPLQVAESLYWNGRIDEAFNLIRRTPGYEARLIDGRLSLYKGDLDRAVEIFSAGPQDEASEPEACVGLALCHYLGGDLGRAIDTLVRGTARYAAHAPLMMLFSRIVRDRKDVRRCLDEGRLPLRGLSSSSAAAFVRACGRAGAIAEGEESARSAAIEFCQQRNPAAASTADRHEKSGLRRGIYSRAQAEAILTHVSEVAQSAKTRLFPMGGTLLGLVRDQALISWDKDLDFGCFEEEASLRDLWDIFSSSPYFIPMGTVGERLIKLRHLSGVTVDVFVNFHDGDARWHGGSYVCWTDRDFRLKSTEIGGRHFLVPNDCEAYLEHHYGADWRRPDPHFDVFWEAPNVRSANEQHRYLNTMAKALQLLAAGSMDAIGIRLERATKAHVDDVVAAFQYVLRHAEGTEE